MVAPLYTTASGLLFHAGKILVVTIGLPARGKTHISRALERYLRWMGVKTQVVSLGDYRRKILGGTQKVPQDYFTLGMLPILKNRFVGLKDIDVGEKSAETQELRKKISAGCEKLIWEFFESGGQVVIYDANNGTRAGRQALAEKFDKAGIHVVMLGTRLYIYRIRHQPMNDTFSETVCDNKEIIETNIRSVKISSPDVCIDATHFRDLFRNLPGQYRGWNPDKAVQDYYLRIRDHEKYYETVEETTWPFIRIINVGIRNGLILSRHLRV
jgi:6-phosphofructo-2-kinase/fructose-2,6-biphosphatase 4